MFALDVKQKRCKCTSLQKIQNATIEQLFSSRVYFISCLIEPFKNNPSIPSEKISKFQLCKLRRIKKCPAKKFDIVDCFTNNQIQIPRNTKINVNLLHTLMFPRLSFYFIENAFSLLNDCKLLYWMLLLFHLHCTKCHCLRGHIVFVHGLGSVLIIIHIEIIELITTSVSIESEMLPTF